MFVTIIHALVQRKLRSYSFESLHLVLRQAKVSSTRWRLAVPSLMTEPLLAQSRDWDVRYTMPENLVGEALHRAMAVIRPLAWLIVHSDQGSQYTATRFNNLLAQYGAM